MGTKRGLRVLMAASAALTLTVMGAALAAASAPEDEQRLVDLTAGARQAEALPAYATEADLADIARRHAQRMAEDGELSHNPNLLDEVKGWDEVGENIGRARTADGVHEEWMRSEEHRTRILSSRYTEVGIGVFVDDGGVRWVSQVFRRPSPPPQEVEFQPDSSPAPASSEDPPAASPAAEQPAEAPAPSPPAAPKRRPANGSAAAPAPAPAPAQAAAPEATTDAVEVVEAASVTTPATVTEETVAAAGAAQRVTSDVPVELAASTLEGSGVPVGRIGAFGAALAVLALAIAIAVGAVAVPRRGGSSER